MKKWFPLWIFPALVLFSFATVWIRLTVVKKTYELNQVSRVVQNFKLENEQLELQVAQLRSPRRLEALSKTLFHLRAPEPNRIIKLKEVSP